MITQTDRYLTPNAIIQDHGGDVEFWLAWLHGSVTEEIKVWIRRQAASDQELANDVLSIEQKLDDQDGSNESPRRTRYSTEQGLRELRSALIVRLILARHGNQPIHVGDSDLADCQLTEVSQSARPTQPIDTDVVISGIDRGDIAAILAHRGDHSYLYGGAMPTDMTAFPTEQGLGIVRTHHSYADRPVITPLVMMAGVSGPGTDAVSSSLGRLREAVSDALTALLAEISITIPRGAKPAELVELELLRLLVGNAAIREFQDLIAWVEAVRTRHFGWHVAALDRVLGTLVPELVGTDRGVFVSRPSYRLFLRMRLREFIEAQPWCPLDIDFEAVFAKLTRDRIGELVRIPLAVIEEEGLQQETDISPQLVKDELD